jgi:hypothetical protein
MPWLILLLAAFGFAALGKRLKQTDEIYAVALYATGILSAIWGFMIAPSLAQLTLSALTMGWLQISYPRA